MGNLSGGCGCGGKSKPANILPRVSERAEAATREAPMISAGIAPAPRGATTAAPRSTNSSLLASYKDGAVGRILG